MGFFSKALENEFETDVVNEPSVFEPLKVYCIKMNEYILGKYLCHPIFLRLFSKWVNYKRKEVASVGDES